MNKFDYNFFYVFFILKNKKKIYLIFFLLLKSIIDKKNNIVKDEVFKNIKIIFFMFKKYESNILNKCISLISKSSTYVLKIS